MSEYYRGGNREAERKFMDNQVLAENGRQLLEQKESLEAQILTGERTDPKHLDEFLTASADYYEWQTLHPQPWQPEQQRETHETLYEKYTHVAEGSYHQEKAIFCIEEASRHQEIANREGDVSEEESQAITEQERQYATNWRQVAINCLQMPDEGRPVPPFH